MKNLFKIIIFVLSIIVGSGSITFAASAPPVQHVSETAVSGGGSNKAKYRDLAGTLQQVSNSRATIYSIVIINTQSATTAYIQVFDALNQSVTLGTTNPDIEIYCPGLSYCFAPIPPTTGVAMNTGISIASTTAERGNSGSASGVEVWLYYKN